MNRGEISSHGCRSCPRLTDHLDGVRAAHPGYHAAPVESFGSTGAPALVVGLAPGMHGANATGRPFTGDHAGILLYRTLYEIGWSSAPVSEARDDGLALRGCRITNAVRCLPPQNRPTTDELRRCNGYLVRELEAVPCGGVVVALGRIAHDAVLRAAGCRLAAHPFGHGRRHELNNGRWRLLDSYHCSRYNTQTRRLTPRMFQDVFQQARDLAAAI